MLALTRAIEDRAPPIFGYAGNLFERKVLRSEYDFQLSLKKPAGDVGAAHARHRKFDSRLVYAAAFFFTFRQEFGGLFWHRGG